MRKIKPVKMAVIGCGDISWTYFQNLTENFGILDVVGCSDLLEERSAIKAKEFNIRQMTNEEIFADPEIELVLNITDPCAHYDVTEQALNAGKHVYTEKMMAVRFTDAVKLAALAEKRGLRIGCAPDTFLGGPYQTARKLIDDGYLGKVTSAQALLARGYRADSADPFPRENFLFTEGCNMPLDMGCYYIHALVHLLGPVRRACGFAVNADQNFANPKNEHYGESVGVTGSTSITAALEFDNNILGNLTVLGESFGETPRIEIYGTDGTLILPDPNTYSGPLYLLRRGTAKPLEIPITHWYNSYNNQCAPGQETAEGLRKRWYESRRGLGVADMAWAIRNGRPHRCSMELGLHAMEIVHAVEQSCRNNTVYTMTVRPPQPAALKPGFLYGGAEAVFDTK